MHHLTGRIAELAGRQHSRGLSNVFGFSPSPDWYQPVKNFYAYRRKAIVGSIIFWVQKAGRILENRLKIEYLAKSPCDIAPSGPNLMYRPI